jgi:hypothetical protein
MAQPCRAAIEQAIRVVISGQFILECFKSGRSRVEPYVFLERGKVDEVSIQHIRRHPILDSLLCFVCSGPNDASYFSENALNIRWKASDVFVDVLGRFSRFHSEVPKE